MNFGMLGAGAALGIAAIGSAIGIGLSGSATIGAWKRCYLNNKPAPFILTVFAGAPLTQTIYGYLVMMFMMRSEKDPWYLMGLGIFAGLGMCFSAIAFFNSTINSALLLSSIFEYLLNYKRFKSGWFITQNKCRFS